MTDRKPRSRARNRRARTSGNFPLDSTGNAAYGYGVTPTKTIRRFAAPAPHVGVTPSGAGLFSCLPFPPACDRAGACLRADLGSFAFQAGVPIHRLAGRNQPSRKNERARLRLADRLTPGALPTEFTRDHDHSQIRATPACDPVPRFIRALEVGQDRSDSKSFLLSY